MRPVPVRPWEAGAKMEELENRCLVTVDGSIHSRCRCYMRKTPQRELDIMLDIYQPIATSHLL
jgi:hypothetical protein